MCDDIHKPFVEKGYEVDGFYYYGEIMIDKDYRNKGIAKRIYQIREHEAKEQGYSNNCFATIVKDNSKMPKDYFDPTYMWKSLGFVEHMDMQVECQWPRIQNDGSTTNEINSLNFWIKDIAL